jgi:hypothetical protein
MNRQFRRAQAKQDKKVEREKDRRKSERKARIQSVRQQRRRVTKPSADSSPKPRGRLPGRFSGALMIATVFFIVLQSAVPPPEQTAINSGISAGFYLLLAYFMMLWLLRRTAERAFMLTIIAGVMLALGAELGKLFRPEYSADYLMLALIVPGLILGALLGRLVFYNSP